jgi:transposase
VRNGLTPPGNSGVVKVIVDTIKMITLQMYGRPGFPLGKR